MITRRTPLKRSTKPIARIPVKKRRTGKPRRGPAGIPADQWRNPGYREFLREEGRCVACFQVNRHAPIGLLKGWGLAPCAGACDPAHGPVNGTASKGPDAEAIPLCRAHHDEQHKMGWLEFEKKYGFSRDREAAAWWTAYTIWKEAQA